MCQLDTEEFSQMKINGLDWDDSDFDYATRELCRSVRYISQASDLMSREHLLLNLDSMPKWAGTTGAPKIEKLIQKLIDNGNCAARVPDSEPVFITDAPFEKVLLILKELNK